MSSVWRIGFLASHIVQWVMIITFIYGKGLVTQNVVAAAANKPDALALASELGRLDLVSVLLAVLGITMSLAGVFGFVEIRIRSEAKATETAKAVALPAAREVAQDAIQVAQRKMDELIVQQFMPTVNRMLTSELESIRQLGLDPVTPFADASGAGYDSFDIADTLAE